MGQTNSANRRKVLIFAVLIDSKAWISKAIQGMSLGIFIRARITRTNGELDCKETYNMCISEQGGLGIYLETEYFYKYCNASLPSKTFQKGRY